MKKKKIRYAAVGLGYIAQTAMLPAFKNASKNSELVALVSGDELKLKKLGRKYGVSLLCTYQEYAELLNSGDIDAVYIATPNNLHREFSIPALQRGIHVLCEKPMATTVEDCKAMLAAAQGGGAKLMVAYRLHFEAANLEAVRAAKSGKIGDLRFYSSIFSTPIHDRNNIRLYRETGGGTFFDIGIYCINAARYLFRSEPIEVFASATPGQDSRFSEINDATTAILRFPENRLANFVCSFSASNIASYDLVGTKGNLRLENAFEYSEPMDLYIKTQSKPRYHKHFHVRDQFGPELVYFSDCILNGVKPEPCGREGLADVRIIEALFQSLRVGKPVRLKRAEDVNLRLTRPDPKLKVTKPKVLPPKLVHVVSPQ